MKNVDPALPKKTLEERKLEYVQVQDGVEAQTPSSTIRSISNLLRQSRKRNDASNRTEFLQSVAEKRRRLNTLGESSSSAPDKDPNNILSPEVQEGGVNDNMDVDVSLSSCARADAKSQDRDFQMKYDIAKNEDGPLKRTMKREQVDNDSSGVIVSATPQSRISMDRNGHEPTAGKHPELAGRMETIEDHLGVRFVPSRPRSLQDRLKFL
ncbi:uncharacterized protein FOMMEDRAFT_20354, partial [Fomitiporia mediterranea MF3/22]|uniref:uncharacterized protein n=1 Tax=Fomitiporia mediterranea (strain MF3/22) TaxID=694068 RepID=UPI00044096E2